jgi:hypothetical protein
VCIERHRSSVYLHNNNEWKRHKDEQEMQVANTKTQTTNTRRHNSMLFQDEEDLGKFEQLETFDSKSYL